MENREILQKLEDFCKVRNYGDAFSNTDKPTPRAQFIIDLCAELDIPCEVDRFTVEDKNWYNLILRGT